MVEITYLRAKYLYSIIAQYKSKGNMINDFAVLTVEQQYAEIA